MCQVNNSVTFSGKPIGFEELLNQMVEALGIIIDRRRPKGRPRKRGNFNHRKNRMYCPILIKKIEGEEEK